MPSTETHPGAHLLATSACFVVGDVFSSAEYYRDTLGFSFDTFFGDPPSFVMLRRDGIVVMLKQLPGATSQTAGHRAPRVSGRLLLGGRPGSAGRRVAPGRCRLRGAADRATDL